MLLAAYKVLIQSESESQNERLKAIVCYDLGIVYLNALEILVDNFMNKRPSLPAALNSREFTFSYFDFKNQIPFPTVEPLQNIQEVKKH